MPAAPQGRVLLPFWLSSFGHSSFQSVSVSLLNMVLNLSVPIESLAMYTSCFSSCTSRNLSLQIFHGLHRNLAIRALISRLLIIFLKTLKTTNVQE